MTRSVAKSNLEALWKQHHDELRDPQQIITQWKSASEVDPKLLEYRVRGRFWDALAKTGQTLIVTREYEHLVMAFSIVSGRPRISYLHLPHPNGLAVDSKRNIIYIASTRNPNMIYEFAPCSGMVSRDGLPDSEDMHGILVPARARYLPGCLYIHDIALLGGRLHAKRCGHECGRGIA